MLKRSVVARGKEGRNRQGAEDAEGNDSSTLYDTIMTNTCRYTFVQTRRAHDSEQEL